MRDLRSSVVGDGWNRKACSNSGDKDEGSTSSFAQAPRPPWQDGGGERKGKMFLGRKT